MDTPLVSVILATYNGSKYLSEAIHSVLAQDYQNIELIIIDDASTDIHVSHQIEQYQIQDDRVRHNSILRRDMPHSMRQRGFCCGCEL